MLRRDSAAILLSTFNGGAFLSELLESLNYQTHSSWTLYWRDDGSTDDSVSIVRNASLVGKLVEMPPKRRLGPARSFLALLREASGSHGSYHFADQDDIWLPEKVARAHAAVSEDELPALFHCRQQLVGPDGAHLGQSRAADRGAFENALVENIIVGCSAAFNGPAAALGAFGSPENVLMHDWWMYLIGTCFGSVQYDPCPQILYRQHGSNTVGAAQGGFRGVSKKFRRHLSRAPGSQPLRGQLRDFLSIHGASIAPDRRLEIERLASGSVAISHRLSLTMRPGAWRQSSLDQLLLRLILLSGRY
jgi:glycosyltransferase involved in cell wall biosynthesis